jgi:hypothetical protein
MRRKLSSLSPSRLTVRRDKPGILQGLGLAGQQQAIGGQGDFDRLSPIASLIAAQLRQFFDQPLDTAPQQRLATAQADLADAQLDEGAGDPLDLLEAEQFAARQEKVILAERCAWHAVGAAKIATVGDRDAQVTQGPLQEVGGCWHWVCPLTGPVRRQRFRGPPR